MGRCWLSVSELGEPGVRLTPYTSLKMSKGFTACDESSVLPSGILWPAIPVPDGTDRSESFGLPSCFVVSPRVEGGNACVWLCGSGSILFQNE